MPLNWWMLLIAGLIPLLVGFVWYSKLGFGSKWMKLNGFTEESLKTGNMAILFGLSYIFSVFIALTMSGIVIHQLGALQMMMPDVAVSGSETQKQFNDLMMTYGGNFRTFKHGALHGALFTVFLALPLIGINALFERRGWAYIWIHTGYWFISLVLMGGLLCATLLYGPVT